MLMKGLTYRCQKGSVVLEKKEMKTPPINYFDGQHCETTATGTLLRQLGIELSEPMLFGIGEGLGFIYWNMKTMGFPFMGGRIKAGLLTQNIAKNVNLELAINETASKRKAWDQVKKLLDEGLVVGLKLDCYHLTYFSNRFHFAGHYVAIYGYDDDDAFLVDTRQQGGKVKTSLESLALARAEKGPMASKNLCYTLKQTGKKFDLKETIRTAIRNNANDYLNPPITNIGYKGILKASAEISNWFETSQDIENEFKASARMMEKAGTGGALFRNLYRDFLKEGYELLNMPTLKQAHLSFLEIADLWTEVSGLLLKVGETKDRRFIVKAAQALSRLSTKERNVMQHLSAI
jgi:hypothetical protein